MSNTCVVSRWHITAPLNSLSMAIIWVIVKVVTLQVVNVTFPREAPRWIPAARQRGKDYNTLAGFASTVLYLQKVYIHIIILPTTKYFHIIIKSPGSSALVTGIFIPTETVGNLGRH